MSTEQAKLSAQEMKVFLRARWVVCHGVRKDDLVRIRALASELDIEVCTVPTMERNLMQ